MIIQLRSHRTGRSPTTSRPCCRRSPRRPPRSTSTTRGSPSCSTGCSTARTSARRSWCARSAATARRGGDDRRWPRSPSTSAAPGDRPLAAASRRSSTACPRRWASCPTSTSASISRTGCARARASSGRSTAATGATSRAWDETFQKDYAPRCPAASPTAPTRASGREQIDAVHGHAQPPRRVVGAARRDPRARARRRRRPAGEGVAGLLRRRLRGAGTRLPRPRALPDGRLLAARAGARAASAWRVRGPRRRASSSTSATRCSASRTCAASCCSPTPATSTTTSPPTRSCASATTPTSRSSAPASPRARWPSSPRKHGIAQDEIVAVVQRVLREGPECLGDLAAGVHFWADVWDAVHLEEIYVEIAAPCGHARGAECRRAPRRAARRAAGVDARPHVDGRRRRASRRPWQLLHHEGILVAQDLFAGDVGQYASFRGPGKLEGSIVNWLNGADLPARRRAQRLPR